MKNLVFVLSLLFVITAACAPTKKIKIKGEKSVKFFYEPDSSAFEHEENIKILTAFHAFFKAVKEDNYQGYLDALSPVTHKRIPAPKLERKFIKFKGYAVNLIGKINVRSIRAFERDTPETNPVYVCTVALPEGQKIEKRVGFDPLKRKKFEGVENHVGLHMALTEKGYKAVILW